MERQVKRLLEHWEAAATDVSRVGVELELLPFRPNGRRIAFEGVGGIGAWLEHLHRRGWSGTRFDDGSFDMVTGEAGTLSVELGCQLELSLGPSRTLAGQTARRQRLLAALAGAGAELSRLHAVGYDRSTPPARLPPFPARSLIFDEAARRADASLAFVRRSAAAHLNVSYASLEDLEGKLRAAVALAPVGVALGCALRAAAGRVGRSWRTDVYLRTFRERTGCFGVSRASGDALAGFARRVAAMPLIYRRAVRKGREEWVACRGECLQDGRCTLEETLKQVLTSVRLQRVVEVRFFDSQPWTELIHLLALVHFVLGDEGARRLVCERLASDSEAQWRRRLWRAADPATRFSSADCRLVLGFLSEVATARPGPAESGANVGRLKDAAHRLLDRRAH